MAVDVHALHLNHNGANAEDVRRFHSALFGATTGPMSLNGLAVAQAATPNMTVDVATGSCVIEGTESTYQGAYFVDNRGTANLPIVAADATNARIDLVCAYVVDTDAANSRAHLEVVAGTPAPSPTDPTVPENACVLARILVPALASSITDADITDLRFFGSQQLVAGTRFSSIVAKGSWNSGANWNDQTVAALTNVSLTWTAREGYDYEVGFHSGEWRDVGTSPYGMTFHTTLNGGDQKVLASGDLREDAGGRGGALSATTLLTGLTGSQTITVGYEVTTSAVTKQAAGTPLRLWVKEVPA